MERQLIARVDQLSLRVAPSAFLAGEIARVRQSMDVPASWRLDPSWTAFYNPGAMTQAEIDAYDASQKAAQRDKELALRALKALASAIHKRFKAVVPTDATTAAQWKAAIDAEWDALA